jgi:hypothetical protein
MCSRNRTAVLSTLACTAWLSVASVPAYGVPIAVDMTTDVWTITAFDTGGNDWTGSTLNFESQTASADDWLLSGYFYWESDLGPFGRENFTGTLFSDRSLHLVGTELVAPFNGIILGEYFAELALSGDEIINGTWQANVPFLPTDGWTATRATTAQDPAIPEPATLALFGLGLTVLIAMRRRQPG